MKQSIPNENGQGNENKKQKIIPTVPLKSMQPQMNEIILRFPDLAKRILNQLDNESLAKCKNVSRSWSSYMNRDISFWKRIIQKYTNNIREFKDTWRCIMTKAGLENIKEIAMAVKHFISIHPSKCPIKVGECTHRTVSVSPLHVAIKSGKLSLCIFILGRIKDKNPAAKGDEGWTPLYEAAQSGFL